MVALARAGDSEMEKEVCKKMDDPSLFEGAKLVALTYYKDAPYRTMSYCSAITGIKIDNYYIEFVRMLAGTERIPLVRINAILLKHMRDRGYWIDEEHVNEKIIEKTGFSIEKILENIGGEEFGHRLEESGFDTDCHEDVRRSIKEAVAIQPSPSPAG